MGAFMDIVSAKPQNMVVHRNEPMHPPAAFPQLSGPIEIDVRYEEAPKPVADSSFFGVGRDREHVGRKLYRYQALAISEWLSVAGWPFKFPKVPSALVTYVNPGRQNPIRERVNITPGKQTSLGALTTMQGVQSLAPEYAKITP